jgi:YHS domain-containing protein
MKSVILCLCLISTLAILHPAKAQDKEVRKAHYNIDGNGLAMKGYDPVSYFSGNPLKGSKNIVTLHEGVIYRFNTMYNKEKFLSDPEKYSPAYGGWCAYAMGDSGEKVEVNILTYKIKNDRLFLFYNKLLNNTLTDWNENEKQLMEQADRNWENIIR